MTRFSNTTDRDGIIELIERDTNTQSVTTSSYPLKVKTNYVNEALSHFFLLAIKAGGRFQVDDTNQTNLPIITTDIVASQPDYTFLVDDSTPANQILDIRKIRIKDANGQWKEITQVDRETFNVSDYENVEGTPEYFDLTGNSVILYPTPDYSSDESLEIYISRTPSYFVSTDTTKEPGVPKIFHSYFHLRPSYFYCLVKDLPQAAGLKNSVDEIEKSITDYYSRRNRTESSGGAGGRLRVRQESNR